MWMRLAAPAIVLALASPVWASEMQMKEKKDPKAEQQKQGAPQPNKQDPAEDAKQQDAKKKKELPDRCHVLQHVRRHVRLRRDG